MSGGYAAMFLALIAAFVACVYMMPELSPYGKGALITGVWLIMVKLDHHEG